MKLFVLAVIVPTVAPDAELTKVGYFDDLKHCRSESKVIMTELHQRNPHWVSAAFYCRPRNRHDRNVVPRVHFLPRT